MSRGHRLRCGAAFMLAVLLSPVRAEFVLGQTLPLSGSQAPTGRAIEAGARLYIDAANARGGVRGQSLRLVTLDDAQVPATTVQNARTLVERERALALVAVVGTANNEALIASGLLENNALPLIGPTSGAASMNGQPWVFPIKAGYRDEVRALLDNLLSTGFRRIGIVWQDDGLGREVRAAAEAALGAASVRPAFDASYPRNTTDVQAAVRAALATPADAILLGGVTASAAEFVRLYRQNGGRAVLALLSIVDVPRVLEKVPDSVLRPALIGVVFPSAQRSAHPLIAEILHAFRTVARTPAPGELTSRFVEGYVAAKVAVEALRRAGPSADSARVAATLRSIRRWDAGGGFTLDFADPVRPASPYVRVALIRHGGVIDD